MATLCTAASRGAWPVRLWASTPAVPEWQAVWGCLHPSCLQFLCLDRAPQYPWMTESPQDCDGCFSSTRRQVEEDGDGETASGRPPTHPRG